MWFEKERSIRKQLLDNSADIKNYIDENADPQRVAVDTMIKIQAELMVKRRRRAASLERLTRE